MAPVATGASIPAPEISTLISTSGVLAGGYRVLGSVGRGAIAEVVRARDERTGGEVALKVLYPHLRESAVVVERFRREVEIVRRIAHPHVLAIRDVVESGEHLFLVMDYHPGGDLADRLARAGRLAPPEIRALAAQLCGALAAAHRAGVVHRDVKPSNVLCGPGPALDVRLCDFGLARTAELAGLTTQSAVLGTPEYMAPEVISDGHADPRSDIYSLGVVLYEAATGRLPFTGDSPYQLMRQHLDLEAPRARNLAADLPPEIDDAIARALAKDPLDRFATADDLSRALAERAPGSTAALAPARPSAAVRRSCHRCGGWVVDAAAVCADCGTRMLRLEREAEYRGVSVLVTGPGKPADKIDAGRHVALYKILDELPPGSVPTARGRRRAPRVPFYVAKHLTVPSAEALVERLHAAGFDARIETRFAPEEVRSKLGRQSLRYLAGVGGFNLLFQTMMHLPRGWIMAASVSAAGGLVSILTALTVRSARSIATPRPSIAQQSAPAASIAAALPLLATRPDRRLCAHVLDRLAQLGTAGRDETARAVADHAAQAAGGLAALDARRSADDVVPAAPERALEELRREERVRVVLRAALLRAASLLDDLALVTSRAGAAGSGAEIARLEGTVQDLAFEVAAEAELAALLEPGR
jgi:hypothetical protein